VLILAMGSEVKRTSVGILWTTSHHYVDEISSIISEEDVDVTIYFLLEQNVNSQNSSDTRTISVKNLRKKELLNLISSSNHDSIIVCGWHLSNLRFISRKFPKRVILFMDNPWRSTLRQYFGVIAFRTFARRNYDGVLVPGSPQEDFAKWSLWSNYLQFQRFGENSPHLQIV
jgi:hypothetical protein